MSAPQSAQVRALYQAAPLPHRKTMLAMRKEILSIIPQAEEVVSYGMPAFKVNGYVVAGILNAKNHVGYYPFSGSVLSLFPKELRNFRTTKSAVHVPIDEPLPKSLMRKLITARISQCPVKQGKVNLKKYESQDGVWREIGLAAPARRGLVDHGIFKKSDLRKFSLDELAKIHGIGTNALRILKQFR